MPWRRVNESLLAIVSRGGYLIKIRSDLSKHFLDGQSRARISPSISPSPDVTHGVYFLGIKTNESIQTVHPTVKELSVEVLSMLTILEVRSRIIPLNIGLEDMFHLNCQKEGDRRLLDSSPIRVGPQCDIIHASFTSLTALWPDFEGPKVSRPQARSREHLPTLSR